VFRALQLGDMLCAVPALRALRAAMPGAEITLIGLPWAAAFAGRFRAYVDAFAEFPGFPGLPEREPEVERFPAFLAAMQARRFDWAIQLHGGGTLSNPLVALLGARRLAGFVSPGAYCPDRATFLPWPERGLEVRRLLQLAEFLGAPSRGEHLEFPIDADDERALRGLPGAADLEPGSYVCIHPGASVPERCWPVEHFADVARRLQRLRLRVVLTGTAAEAELTRTLARSLPAACLDLAGRTGLGALAALLRDARLLVCNDTGVSHVAAALGTPSVVISTGDNPDRWAPADGRRHRVLCRERGVSPHDVLLEAHRLLAPDPALIA
jgi:ADP-heptose:LPS heptosyltransferase